MPVPDDRPLDCLFDWVVAPLTEWARLAAGREIRSVDDEGLRVMLGERLGVAVTSERALGSEPMLRALDLDPAAIRTAAPGAMAGMEQACAGAATAAAATATSPPGWPP
ncbi:DUF6455 family protein [Methylobacterium sp. JK268]